MHDEESGQRLLQPFRKLTRSSSIPKINMVLKSVEKANRAAKGVIRRRTSADAIVH